MKALFESREEFEKFLLDSVLKLTKVMAAALLWLAALTLVMAALTTLWALGITGTEAAAALRSAWQTSTVQALAAAGLSALTLAAIAWWIAKKLHAYIGGKVLLKYLRRD